MVVQQNVEVYITTHIFFPSFSCLPISLSLLFCQLTSSPSFTRSFLLIFQSSCIQSQDSLECRRHFFTYLLTTFEIMRL